MPLIKTALGDDTSAQIAQASGQIGSSVATGAAMAILGPTSLAVPFIGPAIAGIGLIVAHFLTPDLNGRQKIAATDIVNSAADLMQRNLAAYMQSPRTYANQQAALGNFVTIWNKQIDALQNPQLDGPGARAITERQRGGIYDQWKDNYDPIANDPEVQNQETQAGIANGSISNPTPTSGSGSVATGDGSGMFSIPGWGAVTPSMLGWIGIGLVGLGLFAGLGGSKGHRG